jgi:rhomboid protease GluP
LGLSGLLLFLLSHEINSANDKWEGLVFFFIMISSMLIFINAEFIAEDATAKVVSVDKLTDLPREEIRKANYVQVEYLEPDTSSYDYTTDYFIQPQSHGAEKLVFSVYQVCPLKGMKGVFVCSETRDDNSLGLINQFDERLQRWMADFEYRTRGTIRQTALTAHFFKVIRHSDNIEQYMIASSSYISQYDDAASVKDDVILFEISDPGRVDGYWNNVVIILVTLVVLVVIMTLILGLGGVSLYEYNESRRYTNDISRYLSRNGNFFVLLPPLMMIGWGLYMISKGYNPVGSNYLLFDYLGACTPDSLLVDGEWWRIFTSMFVHRDFMHIFGNIMGYALGVFALSNSLYGRDIALVFLISGALSIGFAVLYSQSSVIGASGGVFGLYGAVLSLSIGNLLFGKRRSDGLILWSFVILIVLAINIVTSFRSDVSMSGHLSGLVSGAIVVWLFRFLYPIFDASYRRYLE